MHIERRASSTREFERERKKERESSREREFERENEFNERERVPPEFESSRFPERDRERV
jgi:hypothetical protein